MTYLILIIINIISLYLMVILISFDPADPGWMQSKWNGSIYNVGGVIGARVSDFLFFYFGGLSYIMPLFILYYMWKLFLNKVNVSVIIFFEKLLIIFILLLICCILAQLIFDDTFYFVPGGIIGNVLFDFIKINPSIIFWISCVFLCFNPTYKVLKFNKSFLYFIQTFQKKIKNIFYKKVGFLFKNQRKKYYRISKQTYFNVPRIYPSFFFKQKKNFFKKKDIKSYNIDQKLNIQSHTFMESSKELHFCLKNKKNEIKFLPSINTVLNINNVDMQYRRSRLKLFNDNDLHNNYTDKYIKNAIIQKKITVNMFKKCFKKNVLNTVKINISQKKYNINNIESVNNVNKPCISTNNINNTKKLLFLKNKVNPFILRPIKNNSDMTIMSSTYHNKYSNDVQFILPDFNLLIKNTTKDIVNDSKFYKMSQLIEKKLSEYHIVANVAQIVSGPVITRFELDLSAGIKSSKISRLSRDLARSLSVASVQVIEVIPGTPYVGLEIPNKQRRVVYLQDIICSNEFKNISSPLALIFGIDIIGEPVIKDLKYMPHLLVAGTTGSGKSIGINIMIISILYKATPENVRFIMIDPKILELSVYSGIPHLLTKVITDMQEVESILEWCVKEMENRYKLMSIFGVRNLEGYNDRIQEMSLKKNISDPAIEVLIEKNINNFKCCVSPISKKLPYIVVIIDEFSDLMIMTAKKVELLIIRLTQKARAAGIHIILSTQRPSVNVITGVIKANIPARIAFTVSSKIDSRTILGQSGAESLLGMGDMLYLSPSSSELVRIHGAYVTDQEIYAVVKFWKNQRINAKYLYKI